MVAVEPLGSAATLALQRRVWRVQRAAWALMALAVIAALLGLMGSGPLSNGSVTGKDGAIRVEYERFLRRGATTTLRIHAALVGRETATLVVWLARAYLDEMTITSVQPPPARAQVSQDRVTWSFELSSPDPGAALTVTIQLAPRATGRLRAAVGVGPGPGLGFGQWVYP